ncbi:MAG: hypothetical protein KC418_00740 [Anaerolineales bacterium]|nr:hypothetical protein [Anaerolineales bacterium]MCB8954734.1 hypothetical protein [Ardenticatenales bacterium]
MGTSFYTFDNAFTFGFPHYGTVGVFTQMSTQAGIVCYDFELVNTLGAVR